MARFYTRNGVWGWTLEAQRAKLREVGYDADREYCDELSDTRAKHPSRIRPEWLEQRNAMLAPTARRRGDTIHVATLLALAPDQGELVSVLVAAFARRDTVRAVDSGLEFSEADSPAVFKRAADDWKRAKQDAQTRPGRQEGNRVVAEKRRAETDRKLPQARPLWRDPDNYTISQVAEIVGLSGKTLWLRLGRRPPRKRKGKSK